MGQKFDVKSFHDRVLEDGAVPVSFLHDKVRRWAAGIGPLSLVLGPRLVRGPALVLSPWSAH